MAPKMINDPRTPGCAHCGSPVPRGAASPRFCCAGCEAVHGLLIEQGLTRYYGLAGKDVSPVSLADGRSLVWLEPLLAAAVARPGPLKTLELDVQGIHCAACVWLFSETFKRRGGSGIKVNPALGKVVLQWDPAQTAPAAWVKEIEGFGYALGRDASRPRPLRASCP